MASMSYYSFENTMKDMTRCLWTLAEGEEKTTERECEKAEYMFDEILTTMMDLGIIDDYDGDLLHDFCYAMNEEGE